jgi:hypothetical protein
MRRSARFLVLVAVAGLLAVPVLVAGPLTPPATISSTYKTLTEVEPRVCINSTNTPGDADSQYKITQPGSYYLVDNVTGVSGFHALEVASPNVTIDLMGFTLQGVAGAKEGIAVTASSDNLTVRNGVVRAFRNGIAMLPTGGTTFGSEASLVENVHVADCPASGQFDGYGILTDNNAIVRSCTVTSNGRAGISAFSNATIEGCAARSNGIGIRVGEGSTVSNCSASVNTVGISGSTGVTMINCTAFDNAGNGLSGANASSFNNCSAYSNTGAGIWTGSSSTITGCSLRENVGGGIARSTGSDGVGFTIIGCSFRLNGGVAITAPEGSSILDCGLQGGTTGILVSSHCVVRGNTCDLISGAAIRATGVGNRIEANNCTDSGTGVQVAGVGNLIVRNSCAGNTTDWDFVQLNVYGPIIDRRAPGSAAVLGFAAASTLATTDPNANFSY